MKARNTSNWPVMAKQCATCVFKTDARGRWVYPEIARKVEERLLEHSQICHHPRHKGKRETHLCRGTRDRQIEFFYRIRFLDASTDAAWEAKRKELSV